MTAESGCTLADGFETREKIRAQVSFLAIGAVGAVCVAILDWRWALACILVLVYGIMGVVMRHLVRPRCPHLHACNDCLQAPPAWTRRLARERETTPLDTEGKRSAT
jgi:hypothetical protein